MEKKDKKIALKILRQIPVLTAALMTLHCVTLLLGYKLCVAEICTIILGVVLVYFLSRASMFCIWHRLGLYYTLLVLGCIWYERYIGFDKDMLPWIRAVVLMLGVAYLCIIYTKKCRNEI